MRHITPGRGIPPRSVAPPSDMADILGRPPSFAAHRKRRELRRDLAVALAEAGRALRSGRRAPGFLQRITLQGDLHSAPFWRP